MFDLLLGALLVGLGIRGWMRGLVREVISLTVLIVGTVAAFRLSTPVGRVLVNMSGISPDAARYVAGMAIFVAIAIAAALVSRALHLGIRFLPGVSTLNRVGGAALSLIALTLVMTLVVSLATVVDLPDRVEQELESSAVAGGLTDPDGLPQRVLGLLSGDRILEMSLKIRDLTGRDHAVASVDMPLELPATDHEKLARVPGAEEGILDLLNRERVAADVDPLPLATGLSDAAFEMAITGYSTGRIEVPDDVTLGSALDAAGILTVAAAEIAVLAAGPETAHVALAGEVKSTMTRTDFTRVGIAVVKGPVGLLIVELFAR